MTCLFSELDGTTFYMTTGFEGNPEIRMPIYPKLEVLAQLPINPRPLEKIRRYKLIGRSGGVFFYDRVVDISDLEP